MKEENPLQDAEALEALNRLLGDNVRALERLRWQEWEWASPAERLYQNDLVTAESQPIR